MASEASYNNNSIDINRDSLDSESLENSTINISSSSNIDRSIVSKYNSTSYSLPSLNIEPIYIFKNKLFIRELLPI